LGDADGVYTNAPGLPLAVFTADCLAVAIEGSGGVGVAHAGWRGVVAGVVTQLRTTMVSLGWEPVQAAVGPGIGPCCFEIGPEVEGQFPGYLSTTTWGTASVDLPAAVEAQLAGLDVWQARTCTHCSDGFFSHRRDGTPARSAGIVWVA
jgi:YfiH family protein